MLFKELTIRFINCTFFTWRFNVLIFEILRGLKTNNGQTALNLVVEAKGKKELALAVGESQTISHAELFFRQMNSKMKVSFRKQLDGQKMIDLIKQSLTVVH